MHAAPRCSREWGDRRRRLRVEFARNDANVRDREKVRLDVAARARGSSATVAAWGVPAAPPVCVVMFVGTKVDGRRRSLPALTPLPCGSTPRHVQPQQVPVCVMPAKRNRPAPWSPTPPSHACMHVCQTHRPAAALPPAPLPAPLPAASLQARRDAANPSKTLFVAGFDPRTIRTRDIEKAFEEFGRIVVSWQLASCAVRMACMLLPLQRPGCRSPSAAAAVAAAYWLPLLLPPPPQLRLAPSCRHLCIPLPCSLLCSFTPPLPPSPPPSARPLLQRCEIKKTYSFVEFENIEDAKEACERVHGSRIAGREVTGGWHCGACVWWREVCTSARCLLHTRTVPSACLHPSTCPPLTPNSLLLSILQTARPLALQWSTL